MAGSQLWLLHSRYVIISETKCFGRGTVHTSLDRVFIVSVQLQIIVELPKSYGPLKTDTLPIQESEAGTRESSLKPSITKHKVRLLFYM